MHPPFSHIPSSSLHQNVPYLRCARTCNTWYMLNITPGSHKNDLLAYSLCILEGKAERRTAVAV